MNSSINVKRLFFIFLGIGVFFTFFYAPEFAPAVDPAGESFALSQEGKAAIGLFFLASIWWVFEVTPIGVTSLMIGVVQALFLIRPAKEAFRDFMDPTVLFILGSLLIGLAFTKSGITKRIAYKMLDIVGENTRSILLGVFVVTALLTHIMAHTAVAATMFPILVTILALYNGDENPDAKPTKFGKALFIGMAYTAGAGSICTLLGGARNPAAVGFYTEFTGIEVSFLDFSLALAPFGWASVFILWGLLTFVLYRPEKTVIPGLRAKARAEYAKLGPIQGKEIFVCVVVAIALAMLVLQSFIPALKTMDRAVPLLLAGILFFLANILTVDDLEKKIPWNIVLLFSGAMSIGFCLWQTGAAQWIAISWLSMIAGAHWLVFLVAVFFLVMLMTNFIMNVAAIAITLPVALVMAQYLGVNPELILYGATAMAGMPFLLLIGAAPNAIAYQSKQFTTGEFFVGGIPASAVIMGLLILFTYTYFPVIGMPALLR